MTRSDLAKRVRQRPFVPFRVVLTEGSVYEVRHSEQIMLARDLAVIGLPDQTEEFFDDTVLVDLFHIVKLEPTPARPPARAEQHLMSCGVIRHPASGLGASRHFFSPRRTEGLRNDGRPSVRRSE